MDHAHKDKYSYFYNNDARMAIYIVIIDILLYSVWALTIFMLNKAAPIHLEVRVMSEKSFALASVSVAIVWGTFFYPPAPHDASRADASTPVSADVSVERLRLEKISLRPAPAPVRQVALTTTVDAKPAKVCAFDGVQSPAGCAPLHKLAGD